MLISNSNKMHDASTKKISPTRPAWMLTWAECFLLLSTLKPQHCFGSIGTKDLSSQWKKSCIIQMSLKPYKRRGRAEFQEPPPIYNQSNLLPRSRVHISITQNQKLSGIRTGIIPCDTNFFQFNLSEKQLCKMTAVCLSDCLQCLVLNPGPHKSD